MIAYAQEGAAGIAIVARNEERLAEVRDRLKEIAPQTQVLSIVADLVRQEDIERVVATKDRLQRSRLKAPRF